MERLYTGGTFDLFHYGHMNFLQQCRKLCPTVIVSLNTDEFVRSYKGSSPVLRYEEREKSILWSGLADEVIPNSGGHDSKPAILAAAPDVICIGDDWASKDYYSQMGFTQEWLDDQNILLCYVPYYRGVSTTELKRRLQDEDVLFVVCCRYSEKHNYVFWCVDAIRKHHPGSDIVVVDSDSEDKSYLDKLEEAGVIVEDAKNTSYETGAWLHAFDKYKDSYQNFMFLQDSMQLACSLPFSVLSEGGILVHETQNVGWDNDAPAREWAEQSYDSTAGDFPETKAVVMHNSFGISSSVMRKVLNSSAFKRWKSPDCKAGSCAWERIWQIVFDENNVTKLCLREGAVRKTFGRRDSYHD